MPGRAKIGSLVLACVVFVWPLWLCTAAALEIRHEVRIEAPKELNELLEKHLKIVRWRDKTAESPRMFRTLFRETAPEIKTLLATEGYFSPVIKSSIRRDNQILEAAFTIEPGERAKVVGFDLQFQGEVVKQRPGLEPDVKTLREQWPLRVGAVFKQSDWEAAKTKILRALVGERYPTARILSSEARVDAMQGQVQLHIVVDSGPLVTFGELAVEGLQRYDVAIVRNLNKIRLDEPYSQAKLQELQESLQNTLYFSYVAVSADARRDRPQRVPIRVTVTETLSRRLGLGVGMNTDTGLRGQIEYSDLNLLDKGWRFNSTLRTETARQIINANLDFPVSRQGYRYGVSAALLRTTIQELDTTTLSVGGRRAIVDGDVERSIGLEYLRENVNEGGIVDRDNAALYPSIVWSKRRFDNILDPMHGYAMTMQLGGGLKSALSHQDFLRLYGKWIRYFSPWGNDQVILRAELGAILAPSQNGIPNVLLFRTGGDQSVRGYAFQSLGLRRGEAVVGARFAAVASAEYVHWLSPKWGGAVFCDIGDAFDNVNDYNANLGFGMGARWRSPVGPVYLDVAYGETSRQLRLHFALGIRF